MVRLCLEQPFSLKSRCSAFGSACPTGEVSTTCAPLVHPHHWCSFSHSYPAHTHNTHTIHTIYTQYTHNIHTQYTYAIHTHTHTHTYIHTHAPLVHHHQWCSFSHSYPAHTHNTDTIQTQYKNNTKTIQKQCTHNAHRYTHRYTCTTGAVSTTSSYCSP